MEKVKPTVHASHGFLCFFARREMNESEIAHHLEFLHITVRHTIKNVTQNLFCGGQRQVAYIQHRNLANEFISKKFCDHSDYLLPIKMDKTAIPLT